MVLPLIAGFVGGLLIGSLIAVAFLAYEEIIDWFDEYLDTIHSSKNNLPFTIKDELENGNYQIVQGIFNQRTGDMIEGREIEAEEIDEELLDIHEEYEDEEGIVLYEI
jgi:hypothetical protein